MTDPIDAPVSEPAPTTDPPDEPDRAIATGPSAAQPVPGWVAPDGAGGVGLGRGCCLGLAVVIAVLGVLSAMSVAFVLFYDQQAASSLAGTIEFEAGDTTGCFVLDPATSFPASTTIHAAAHLSRQLSAQERVTVTVTYPDGTSQSTDTSYQDAGECVSDTIPVGLDAGHWSFEFRSGDEVLATGGFDITP